MAETSSSDWSWLDAAADRFEHDWERGPRPRIEDFLAGLEERRCSALLDELLRIELERRRRRGEEPAAEEYRPRFPEHAAVVDAVFAPGAGSSTDEGHAGGGVTEPAAPRIRRLGDYEIIRELGRGGMGIVYEARQVSLDRSVALKVLPPEVTDDPKRLRRFEREARAAGRLHHTNIVPVFGLGHHDGTHFYIMQLIRGPGLHAVVDELRRLRQPRPSRDDGEEGRHPSTTAADPTAPTAAELARSLATGRFARVAPGSSEHSGTLSDAGASDPGRPALGARAPSTHGSDGVGPDGMHPGPDGPGRVTPAAGAADSSTSSGFSGGGSSFFDCVARIGLQVAEGLHHAHGQGILHRDIKPSNLLLDTQGNPWITDFGLAKATDSDDLSGSRDLVGTLRYLAPERFEGRADARSDVHALGLTLYELLALRPAFDATNYDKLIAQVVNEDPPPLRRLDPAIPRDLATVVHRAIAREAPRRYATAAEMAEDLGRFLGRRPIRARRTPPHERFLLWCRRNPALAAMNIVAATLTTLLAIGSSIAAWTFLHQRNELRFEQGRTLANLRAREKAERTARLELGKSLLAEGGTLQRTGLIGQRFDSLDRLARSANELRAGPDGQDLVPELRDKAVTALGLADVRELWRRDVGVHHAAMVDHRFERSAVGLMRTGEVVVSRLEDGRELLRLPHPGVSFWHLAVEFSPDDRYLEITYHLLGTGGLQTDLWDLDQRERVFRQPNRVGRGFHPNGCWLPSSPEKDLVVWDPVKRREVKRLGSLPTGQVAFDPQGRRVAAASAEGDRPSKLIVLDLETGRERATWTLPHDQSILAWSADGRLLATGLGDGRTFVFDTAHGVLTSVLQGHTNRVIGGRFAHAGHLLATCSWDGTTRLWDASTGQELVQAQGALLRFAPDDRRLAFVSGPSLGVWEVASGRECRTLNPGLIGNRAEHVPPGWSVTTAAFPPRGRWLALGTTDGVHLHDAATGLPLARLDTGPCESVLIGPDAQMLITSGERGVFRWPIRPDPDRGPRALRIGPPELIREFTPGRGWHKAAWLPDHRTLAMIDNANARILLIDAARPRPAVGRATALPSNGNARMTTVAISPDGRWAAAGGWKEAGIPIWDLTTRRLARLLGPADGGGDTLFFVGFSPDGRWLVSASHNPEAGGYYFWHVGSWERGLFLPGVVAGAVVSPAFTRDGRLMALTASPQQLRLVDASTGRTIAHSPILRSLNPTPLAFSPDGTHLVASTNQKNVLLWDFRRIREHLQTMGLDWDQPPFAAASIADDAPPTVTAIGSVLEPTARRNSERTEMDRRLAADPDDAEALVYRSWLSMREQKWADAITDFERLLRLRPADADAPILLAEACLHARRLPAARAALDRHLERSPDDLDARTQRGLVSSRLGEAQAAVDDLTRVLEADPGRDLVRYHRAQAWLRLRRFPDALADLDPLISKYPGDAGLYQLRGASREGLGQHEESLTDLKRARELAPDDPQSLNDLAWRLATGPAHLRDSRLALDLARRAVELAPGEAHYLNTLGVALYRAGRDAEAVAVLERSLAAGKGETDAFDLFFLAMARHRSGQPDRAWADLDRATRWLQEHPPRSPGWAEELRAFRAEAEAVLAGPLGELPADVFARSTPP